MSKIVIYGGTGYTGGNIAREAIARGHEVVAVARNVEKLNAPGAQAITGDLNDLDQFAQLAAEADAIVLAVHHSTPKTADLISPLMAAATKAGARIGVIGGAGSLFTTEGGPRLIETPEFPEEYKTEAQDAFETLKVMEAENIGDWFYVSPAGVYGSWVPGERTGHFRVGGDVLLTDSEGKSFIGGEDFAIAIVDEIENPKHPNQRFTVAY